MTHTESGNVSAPTSEQPADVPLDIPADVLELAAKLRRAGAAQVLYTRGGLVVEPDKTDPWDLGLAQWLVIRLPLGEMRADGRLAEIGVNS